MHKNKAVRTDQLIIRRKPDKIMLILLKNQKDIELLRNSKYLLIFAIQFIKSKSTFHYNSSVQES